MKPKELTHDVILQAWNKVEKPSLGKVSRYLAEQGYINATTNKPYSRQWIRVKLSERPEGRAKMGKGWKSPTPLIVEDRQGVLDWYREHGMLGVERIAVHQVTVPLITRKYVYGDLPVSLALRAKSIWLLVDADGIPITDTLPLFELEKKGATLREYKVVRIR